MHSHFRLFLCGLLPLLVLLLGGAPVLANQVQLVWKAPDTPTPLVGYWLSYWQEPSGIPESQYVGIETTYTLIGFADGTTYTFAMIAYDIEGNASDSSNSVTITMPRGPSLVSPPPGSQLPGATVVFAWTDGDAAVAEWRVSLGTARGAHDLIESGSLGETHSLTVVGVPTAGEPIFVRLWYWAKGEWQYRDFPYTAALKP